MKTYILKFLDRKFKTTATLKIRNQQIPFHGLMLFYDKVEN